MKSLLEQAGLAPPRPCVSPPEAKARHHIRGVECETEAHRLIVPSGSLFDFTEDDNPHQPVNDGNRSRNGIAQELHIVSIDWQFVGWAFVAALQGQSDGPGALETESSLDLKCCADSSRIRRE